MPTIVHLFLDLENLAPPAEHLQLVRGDHFRLWVHYGPLQKKFNEDQVRAWQPLGEKVFFVQSTKSGKNALDMHIAFSLGEAHHEDVRTNTKARYVIISGDKGFDALFGYLHGKGVQIDRAESIPDALKLTGHVAPTVKNAKSQAKPVTPPSTKTPSASIATPAELVRANLREHTKNRPRTRKKLEHHIDSLLGHKVDEAGIAKVILLLEKQAAISFAGTKVSYLQLTEEKQISLRSQSVTLKPGG